MNVLLFEWLMGGGLWQDDELPDPSDPIQSQGQQMLESVAEDLAAAGWHCIVPLDTRVDLILPLNVTRVLVGQTSDLRTQLAASADIATKILLIAPETAGRLESCCQWLDFYCDKFISPDRSFVRLTGNKNATCDFLRSENIPVPPGCTVDRWLAVKHLHEFPVPAVLKPADGAGSAGAQYVVDWSQAQLPSNSENWRIESFVSGHSVSVSAISRTAGVECLVPTGQVFDNWPIGHYQACQFPLPTDIAARATDLAWRTVRALPFTRGYFGMDLVISEKGSSQDCVIEINPRLTASYCKLRQIYGGKKLAEKMID